MLGLYTLVLEKITENPKQLGRQEQPGMEPDTFCLPAFERTIAQSLVEPRMDSLTFMPYPEFEPGTFRAAVGFPSHYTAWSAND